jgi:excisionase family DNA binding protein
MTVWYPDSRSDTSIFLTTDDVLAYLRVNARTVYRLIREGHLPAVCVGRQWRFRQSDLDAWLDSQRPTNGNGNGDGHGH